MNRMRKNSAERQKERRDKLANEEIHWQENIFNMSSLLYILLFLIFNLDEFGLRLGG